MLFSVILLPLFAVRSLTASCWRDTTCVGPAETVFPGAWEKNIYAPASRTVSPKAVLSRDLTALAMIPNQPNLSLNGSLQVFDFGIEVGGIVSINYTVTGDAGALGIAFSESRTYVGEWSDSSNGGFKGPDGALYANFTKAGERQWTMPDNKLRGGFRYMTVFLETNGTTNVHISNITVEISFQPTWSNPRAYQGYFHSNDELLNRIWYAGAYTLQTNEIAGSITALVDLETQSWSMEQRETGQFGQGDMGIAVPSSFVSTGDLTSVKNGLQVMYDYQNPTTGAFPESGPPLLQLNSDTYHMWTMIGTYNYVLFTNDTAFLLQNWAKYKLAMDFVYGKVTYPSGLFKQTGLRDWARWQTGFNNSEAQMILYHTQITGSSLATWAGESSLSTTYTTRAEALRLAIQKYCFDTKYGSFRDNATDTTLYPQDANSMSLLYSIFPSNSTQASSISRNLVKNWTPIGPQTPELPGNISPFISSFELQGHLTIKETTRALDLLRTTWGWYANNPNGSESTVIEGYLVDGSFGYRSTRGYNNDASYVSHAHGWSAGPTSALTNYILGLSIVGRAGSEWSLAPQFGDLISVEGGFTTILGQFSAKWVRSKGLEAYNVTFATPKSTNGLVVLPVLKSGVVPRVALDGKALEGLKYVDGGVTFRVSGGNHTVVVTAT